MKMPAPPPKATVNIENDLHRAKIVAADPVFDPANKSQLLFNDSGKSMVNFRFQLLDEQDDEGNPVVLYRSKMAVSYGQYAGKWADYAALIEASMGIPGGDKAQRNVDTDDFLDKHLRVQTANVAAIDGSGKTYTNVVGYFAPKKAARPAAAPAPLAGETALDAILDDELAAD